MDKDYIKQLEEENAGLKRVRDKIMPKLTRQINKYITAMEYLIEENNKLKKYLEVLEIIKNRIFIDIRYIRFVSNTLEFIGTDFEVEMSFEEYQKIKEWLGND